MHDKKIMKINDSKEANSHTEIKKMSIQTGKAKYEITYIMREMIQELETCTSRHESQIRMTKLCNRCFKPSLMEEIDICVVGKKNCGSDADEGPTSMKQELENLDETYKKSKSIRVVLGIFHNMIASIKPYSDKNAIVLVYENLVDYVRTNPNCQCHYCEAKEEISFR